AMNLNRLFRSPAALLAALGLILAAPGAAQQTGIVTGRVTDARSGAAVPSAQVFIVDTQLGTLTDAEGNYRIANVGAGQRQVRVINIGYRSETVTVSVAAGQPARADFQLAVSAIALDEIIVTGTAGRQDRRAQAASVSSVSASNLREVAPISNVANLLQARTTGVSISSASGTSGGGQRIRLRGSASLNLSNEPLLIIDGVRADNRVTAIYGVGGQATSRLNDINPDDIESVEIVKGPAAATLYGADASAGVIQIRTKRGQAGAGFTQTISYEQATIQQRWDPPSNWAACTASQVADSRRSLCFGKAVGTLVSDNPLKRYDVFKDGNLKSLNWSGRGGGQGYGYYLSFSGEQEQGNLPNNSYDRYTGRVNFDFTPKENLKLEWSMGIGKIITNSPRNDNDIYGYLGGSLLGSPTTVGMTYPAGNDGWYATNRQVRALSAIITEDNATRITPVFTVTYTPFPWFRNRLNAGIDMTRTEAKQFFPKNDSTWYGTADLNSGQIAQGRQTRDEITVDYLGSLRRDFLEGLVADLAFGFQAISRRQDLTQATGIGLTTNATNSINAAARTTGNQQYTEEKEGGVFSQLDLAWRDRLYLQVGGRLDRNSAFGEESQTFFNPKVGLSYVISEEDFYPAALKDYVSTMRLRSVWGSTGRSPGSGASLTTYSSSPFAISSTSVGSGVLPNNPGNKELKPERGVEIELGMDAGLFNERVGLEVTYYDKTSKDLILARPLPPSLGFQNNPLVNIGELKNSGLEMALNAQVLSFDNFGWDARLNVTTNKNEVTDLGDVQPFGTTTRVVEGYPANGWWTQKVRSYDLAGGDVTKEKAIVSDTMEYVGPPNPTLEGNFNSTFTFFKALRVYVQFDFMDNYILYNNTDQFRERQFGQGERWIRRFDPTFTTDKAGNAWTGEERLGRFGPFWSETGAPCRSTNPAATTCAVLQSAMNAEYFQDASHVRFREISVSYTVPRDIAQKFGATSAILTVGGRNLKVWTNYEGADPEALWGSGNVDNFARQDFLTLPQTRRFLARLNLTF
ncbi:MAG: SusC/RagA family TonB-linked outer membrane protein, partial [Gemmatimonadetes bacterium]|nr:SusC/RagA family TonB-linked outer membrane protein [Gemmatimonadota bacterium]